MAVDSVREAFQALSSQLPGFKMAIVRGNWHVYKGRLDQRDDASEDTLDLRLGNVEEIHILPVVSGSKSSFGQIIVGAAIFVAGVYTMGAGFLGSYAAGVGGGIASMGASLALGGVTQMLTKAPTRSTGGAEERSSYLLSGPGQNGRQGSRLTLAYGKIRVGSIVGSAGTQIEKI